MMMFDAAPLALAKVQNRVPVVVRLFCHCSFDIQKLEQSLVRKTTPFLTFNQVADNEGEDRLPELYSNRFSASSAFSSPPTEFEFLFDSFCCLDRVIIMSISCPISMLEVF